MDQERRRAISARDDLGIGRDGSDLGLGRGRGGGGEGGGAVEERGELRFPVHVQDEAPAGVGEGHQHTRVVGVGGGVVVCDLRGEDGFSRAIRPGLLGEGVMLTGSFWMPSRRS